MAVLDEGSSFGELALISDKSRQATIQCLTDCDFAVLKKDDFGRVLKKIEVKLANEKMDFFSNLPFLQG